MRKRKTNLRRGDNVWLATSVLFSADRRLRSPEILLIRRVKLWVLYNFESFLIFFGYCTSLEVELFELLYAIRIDINNVKKWIPLTESCLSSLRGERISCGSSPAPPPTAYECGKDFQRKLTESTWLTSDLAKTESTGRTIYSLRELRSSKTAYSL